MYENEGNYDNSDCVANDRCYSSPNARYDGNGVDQWNPCLLEYENDVCARCKFGMVRIFNIDGVFCGFTDFNLQTTDDNGNTIQPCIIDYYYEGINGYDR